MRQTNKLPLFHLKKRNLELTVGPSAIGISLILVIAILIAFGQVSLTDVAALVPNLSRW